ncbi:MAG: dTMP kinase [Alphaproteobacteria bacterium]|nr:dTMP kinase [Alphaproteobacteria bacterium]
MKPGKFITFEGGEGAGKSTQVRLLTENLASQGLEIVQTREPGGAPQAEVLRELLISGATNRWSAGAEALLNYAARDDHLRTTIRPALERGAWVLCDRFSDSTRAYQGLAGDVSLEMIDAIHQEIVGETDPDLTLVMNIAPEVGLQRAHARGDANRFENKGLAFHQTLQKSFLEIATACPERCVVIDASGEIEEISHAIWSAVESRLLNA